MIIKLHKDFEKQLAKLPERRNDRVVNALDVFLDEPMEPSLRNHALTGEWAGHRSISAGGNLRMHFKVIDQNTVLFVAVGTHSQLYR